MAKRNTVVLLSNIGGTVTSIYLHGSGAGTKWNGSGTPWTNEATTPFKQAMNDRTGSRWTPQSADADVVYSGGPPFVDGQWPLRRSYANIQQTIPVQAYITDTAPLDALVKLKELVQGVLRAAPNNPPCVLGVKPYGTTSMVYYNILDGDVQENPDATNEETDRRLIRFTITLTCSPFGGLLSAGENAISGSSIGNKVPGNTLDFLALHGDLVREGEPLNVTLKVPTANIYYKKWYLATVASATFSDNSSGTHSTSTETELDLGTFDIDAMAYSQALKLRLLLEISGDANAEVQLFAFTGAVTVYASPWLPVTDVGLLDVGAVTFDSTWLIPDVNAAIAIALRVRSTDGNSCSITLGRTNALLYYTFCQIEPRNVVQQDSSSPDTLRIVAFPEVTQVACLPLPIPKALTIINQEVSSTLRFGEEAQVRGTLPKYYLGASLVMFALETADVFNPDTSGYVYDDSRTLDIVVHHAPLWRTLRGT